MSSLIDVHAHATPEGYLALCTKPGKILGGSFKDRFVGFHDRISIEQRIGMMDAAGVRQQIISPTCAPYSHDKAAAVEAARYINDEYAELSEAKHQRFGFWASLPLPHVDEAIAEVRRTFDEKNARGVVLGCFCIGQSIADAAFDRLYEELDRRKAVVFLHPCQTGIDSPQINEWGLTVCAGASLEDSAAVMHLIARATPNRFPGIRFIVPHFGGILPILLNRLDGQMPREGLPEAPSATARRFFYDTVGWGSRPALLAAIEAFGPTQIVTGSDFPILLNHESYTQTFDNIRNSGLDAQVIETILGNAPRLLQADFT